jgi:hypothetical protein
MKKKNSLIAVVLFMSSSPVNKISQELTPSTSEILAPEWYHATLEVR